jgi:hypothetical protein
VGDVWRMISVDVWTMWTSTWTSPLKRPSYHCSCFDADEIRDFTVKHLFHKIALPVLDVVTASIQCRWALR